MRETELTQAGLGVVKHILGDRKFLPTFVMQISLRIENIQSPLTSGFFEKWIICVFTACLDLEDA